MKKNEITVVFYKEHTDDPRSWVSPRPSFDLAKFNKRLELEGGCIGSVPRFRCRWAGELLDYQIEDYDTLEGYVFIENGIERRVSCRELDFEFPDGAIITPFYENRQVFTPRFVIDEFKGLLYEKAWMIETVQITGKEYGKIEVLSTYREPADVDIQMAKHLSYLRQHLTNDQIQDGLAQLQQLQDNEALREREELAHTIAEETAKALTDGLPNASKFGFNPNLKFDIKQHSKNLIKEHDSRI